MWILTARQAEDMRSLAPPVVTQLDPNAHFCSKGSCSLGSPHTGTGNSMKKNGGQCRKPPKCWCAFPAGFGACTEHVVTLFPATHLMRSEGAEVHLRSSSCLLGCSRGREWALSFLLLIRRQRVVLEPKLVRNDQIVIDRPRE